MRTNSVKSCSSLGCDTRGMHHSDHSNPSEVSPFTIWRKILPCTALDCNNERQVWETKHSSSGALRINKFRLITWNFNASQHYPSQLRGQVNQNTFAVLRDSIRAFVRWIMLFHQFSLMFPCELASIKSVFHYASNISHLKQFPIPFWKVTPNIKRKRCLRPFLGPLFFSYSAGSGHSSRIPRVPSFDAAKAKTFRESRRANRYLGKEDVAHRWVHT